MNALRNALIFSAFVLAGCGPPWKVVVQANPDPMLGQKRFAVLPVDFQGLRVGEKSEEEYLAEKDGEQQQSFVSDLKSMNEAFTSELIKTAHEEGLDVVLATGPGAAPFELRPHIPFIEPGYFVGVSSRASRTDLSLVITSPDGQVIDQINMQHATGGSFSTPSITLRLQQDAKALGAYTARYLKYRSTGTMD